MIPDLRARLKAVAQKESRPAEAAVHTAAQERIPLSTMRNLLDVTAEQVRRMGHPGDGWDIRRVLFIDTETTGLRGAGTVAFLVGLGWVEGDSFIIRQLLMRDYPQEPSMLEELSAYLNRFSTLVSFNGKSFDLPLLRDRFVMARMRDRWREREHLDLLHVARRTWRLRLGACNLGALEIAELGVRRSGDLPGAEVPERYFQYLKTGDMALLDDVLRHNRQDIHSLALLLMRLAEVYDAPYAQESMLDVLSAGRALERFGEGALARRCFQVASVSALSRQARLHLARSYRREHSYEEAAQAYHGMIARGEADAQAYTALAILLERHLRRPGEALAVTEQALFRLSGAQWTDNNEAIHALMKRRKRLKGKIQAANNKEETNDGHFLGHEGTKSGDGAQQG